MTAPTPEKIQRYNPQRKHVDFEPVTNGHWVTHSDHLLHLKLAQIAVLEEASKLICKRCDSGDPFPHKKNQNPYSTAKTLCHAARIHALIAALRLEVDP